MLEFRVLLGNSVAIEQVTQPQEPVFICNINHCEVLAPHGLQHLGVSLMSVALLVLVLKTVLRLHQGSSYRSYEKLRQSYWGFNTPKSLVSPEQAVRQTGNQKNSKRGQ